MRASALMKRKERATKSLLENAQIYWRISSVWEGRISSPMMTTEYALRWLGAIHDTVISGSTLNKLAENLKRRVIYPEMGRASDTGAKNKVVSLAEQKEQRVKRPKRMKSSRNNVDTATAVQG